MLQCLTDAFNPGNADHVKQKEDVELGNGLPGIRSTTEVDDAIEAAGLEVRPRSPFHFGACHIHLHTRLLQRLPRQQNSLYAAKQAKRLMASVCCLHLHMLGCFTSHVSAVEF